MSDRPCMCGKSKRENGDLSEEEGVDRSCKCSTDRLCMCGRTRRKKEKPPEDGEVSSVKDNAPDEMQAPAVQIEALSEEKEAPAEEKETLDVEKDAAEAKEAPSEEKEALAEATAEEKEATEDIEAPAEVIETPGEEKEAPTEEREIPAAEKEEGKDIPTEAAGPPEEKGDSPELKEQAKTASDGTIKLINPHIEYMEQDVLYHIGLGSGSHDLVEMFGDVKFVCIGGTPNRMKDFAYYIMKKIGHKLTAGTKLDDISYSSNRYSMYKVGPVISASHGMGEPSVSILLHELIKLMHHSKAVDPVFFRIGTSGGVGVEPGTVVITDGAFNGLMNSNHEIPVLGKMMSRPAILDEGLIRDLKNAARPDDRFKTVSGKTMCTCDFYEGQARLDGAFCEYSESDKMDFLTGLSKSGVVNIEMESMPFAALTHHGGIRAAVVCVTLLNRLEDDQISTPKELLEEYQNRPQMIVGRYIKRILGEGGQTVTSGRETAGVKDKEKQELVKQMSENFNNLG